MLWYNNVISGWYGYQSNPLSGISHRQSHLGFAMYIQKTWKYNPDNLLSNCSPISPKPFQKV